MATRPTTTELDGLVADSGPIDSCSSRRTRGTMLDRVRMAEITDWCRNTVSGSSATDLRAHLRRVGSDRAVRSSRNRDQQLLEVLSMTGWRLGWLIMPDPLREALTRIGQNVTISAPTLSQLAASSHSVSMATGVCGPLRREPRHCPRRPSAAGFDDLAPDGAFYVWACIDTSSSPDVRRTVRRSAQWLNTLGLAATPGVDFDPTRGHRYVRRSPFDQRCGCDAAIARVGMSFRS